MQQQHVDNNSSELAPELFARPLVLIGVSGLDTKNNAVHKSIWEIFNNNRRTERVPVQFRLIGNAHEFPVVKPKRNSYEWYIPKGILKRNWMNKHLNEIPAVMVIFYELDWNDGQWNEKMIECASRVQSMRAALEGRNTRITVVLIQNAAPLPAGEDVMASDRAVSLCASCELHTTSLFVLPHGDHLQGYAIRLENAFYDLALTYYNGEIKTVRSHKEHLNKNSHQNLFVRHQFKMGFLYELKQDIQTAHKHYTYAYNHLLEVRIVDTNALEIRTVAGFINYKLCRIMFALNLPRDAISQFKIHIERFKNRIGFQDLSFEHYAWLSKQFQVFGDIFDEAVKLGLPAAQTQHPGIYYQQAAQYAIIRKSFCQELCANVIAYPSPDPLEGANFMEFYGQRPWRRGKLSGEPPDPHLESNGIQALQFLEKQVQHSILIVALYGLAISQYKTYRCPRTRRHLVLQMADEYYNSQDYGKALTLLTHMLWDFRAENWWLLLSDVLEKAINCAFLTANVQDYILLGLEILGKNCMLRLDEKNKIHMNLERLLKKQIPFGDPRLNAEALQSGTLQWQPLILQKEPLQYSIDLSNIFACMEVKSRFMQSKYEVDQNVSVEIFIKCTSPLPMTFHKIAVTINSPSYTSEFAVDNPKSVIVFQPGEIKRFLVEFQPACNDVNKEIQIGAINLFMGQEGECLLDLKFAPTQSYCSNTCPELLHFKYSPESVDFDNIAPILISTLIVPRQSKLKVQLKHALPALIGEWFEIKISIDNEEEFTVKKLALTVNLAEEEVQSSVEFATTSSGLPERLPLNLKVPEILNVGEKVGKKFYIRAHALLESHIDVKISYELAKERPVISVKRETVPVSIVQPFEIQTKFLSTLMAELSKFYVGEEIGVMPTLRCTSPWPIFIENTSMEFSAPFKSADLSIPSHLANTELHEKEVGVELYLAMCEKSSDQHVPVGQYVVKWKRVGGLSATTKIAIVGYPCEWVPLDVKMDLPAHGLVRTPLLINYHLENKSHQLLQLDVSMENSEAFMYAGYKQFSVSILPESKRTIEYNLYPLIAGSVALPRLVLKVPENSTEGPALRPDQLKLIIERSLPTHLYVMPQVKGSPPQPLPIKQH